MNDCDDGWQTSTTPLAAVGRAETAEIFSRRLANGMTAIRARWVADIIFIRRDSYGVKTPPPSSSRPGRQPVLWKGQSWGRDAAVRSPYAPRPRAAGVPGHHQHPAGDLRVGGSTRPAPCRTAAHGYARGPPGRPAVRHRHRRGEPDHSRLVARGRGRLLWPV